MKKNTWIIMLIVLLAGSSLVYAEGMKGGMVGKGMMDGEMMGEKMMGMCPMMQSMMQKQVVATNDGGIFVVTGNKITKYDKDLNVVKEVEQKMDMEGMKKMMKDCPMMGKGMMGEMKEGSKDDATSESISADEHAAHHSENK